MYGVNICECALLSETARCAAYMTQGCCPMKALRSLFCPVSRWEPFTVRRVPPDTGPLSGSMPSR